MHVIGFTGLMGSGKSTAIETLKSVTPIVEVVKFAGPLYDMQEFIYRRLEPVHRRPKDFVKDRKLLQWLGTEWGRSLDSNIWVRLWKHEVSRLIHAYPNDLVIVCDDCRFDNEAQAVRDMGGYVVQLTRDSRTPDAPTGISNHASENGVSLDLVDCAVQNNGTLEEYEASLRELFLKLGVGRSVEVSA